MTSPRLVIAAPHGRSGKTLITMGICAAVAGRGLAVQPFKKGPDYIDPSWLTLAARSTESQPGDRPCRNLDLFMMDAETVRCSFERATRDADLGIVEGAMGLYDGFDVEGTGSTARVARILAAPIVLVVNCMCMTRSVAALVHGFCHFEPDVNIAGVILNNVGRARHEKVMVESIERYCDVPVLGCIPRSPDMELPQRHLGLVPSGEMDSAAAVVEKARNLVESNLDMDRLLSVARGTDYHGDTSGGLHCRDGESAEEDHGGKSVVAGFSLRGPVPDEQGGADAENHGAHSDRFRRLKPAATHQTGAATRQPDSVSPREARIGVLRDRVFSFYYPENLEALAEAGAELIFIDSLQADRLPALDALYIGGGFPELFLDELEANEGLRRDIAAHINQGLPVYAECAGLMYLSRGIVSQGRRREMVGTLPCEVEMSARPVGHGYAVVETVQANPLFPVGQVVRGHEFHHARVVDTSALDCAYRVRRGFGVDGQLDGIVYKNVFASFTHLHALGTPEWAPAFVQFAKTTSSPG